MPQTASPGSIATSIHPYPPHYCTFIYNMPANTPVQALIVLPAKWEVRSAPMACQQPSIQQTGM
jgi:hypothetical protein